MKDKIQAIIQESIAVKKRIIQDESILQTIDQVVIAICNAYRSGNKILICGNGGSAADAQHIAAELGGRFERDRDPLPALALHENSSFVTAVSNDYSYEEVFARAVKGLGKSGDLLIGISTSGTSRNVLNALRAAREKHITTVGLTGRGSQEMQSACDQLIKVPSDQTPRIQEAHITIGHIICGMVENELFPKKKNG